MKQPQLEPRALPEEVGFILRNASRYMQRDPQESDVLSVFAGHRPLVHPGGKTGNSKSISRSHEVFVSQSGLVTIAGGKWTTYRRMAQDVVDHAATLAELEPRPCPTEDLPIHGHAVDTTSVYGSDEARVKELIKAHPEPTAARGGVTAGEVLWAVQEEMAPTVDDVLARRTRLLQLDARAAIEAAPHVARILAAELSRDDTWVVEQVEQFETLARGYLWP